MHKPANGNERPTPAGAIRDESVSSPPVNLAAAAKLPMRDLLAAYALLCGQKVALTNVTLLREAFPALFRSRPTWSAAAWDTCDAACLDAIRVLLRQRGRLHLVAGLDALPANGAGGGCAPDQAASGC